MGLYWPARHSVQFRSPRPVVYDPGRQALQAPRLAFQNRPATHPLQAEEELAPSVVE